MSECPLCHIYYDNTENKNRLDQLADYNFHITSPFVKHKKPDYGYYLCKQCSIKYYENKQRIKERRMLLGFYGSD